MTLAGVKGGNTGADRIGRRFDAIVIERHERELEAQPIDPRFTHHRVKARELLGIWRTSLRSAG